MQTDTYLTNLIRLASGIEVDETEFRGQQRSAVERILIRVVVDQHLADGHRLRCIERGQDDPLLARFLTAPLPTNDDLDTLFAMGPSDVPLQTVSQWLCSPTSIRFIRKRFEHLETTGGLSEFWIAAQKQHRQSIGTLVQQQEREKPYSWLLVRRAIELPLSKLAATQPEELRGRLIANLRKHVVIQEDLLDSDAALDSAEWFESDVCFHAAIVEATGSESLLPIHRSVLEEIHNLALTSPMRDQTDQSMRQCVTDHSIIVRSIASGDPAEVEGACEAHFQRVAKSLGNECSLFFERATRDSQVG